MRLSELAVVLGEDQPVHGMLDPTITVRGITDDSRQVQPGFVFVAVPGQTVDGQKFIPQAVERGAVAVVGEGSPATDSLSVPYLPVPAARLALAELVAAFHGYPARQLKVIGVTGTDGKTTTTTLIHAILVAAGRRAGVVTSIAAQIGGEAMDTGFHVTTPESPSLQSYLAEMVRKQTEYAVLETTSHGLALQRVHRCEYDVAVVTNVTHEHLDFHGSDRGYLEAKARLFHLLNEGYRKPGVPKISILNTDDRSYPLFSSIPADQHFSYSLNGPADFVADAIRVEPQGMSFTIRTPEGTVDIESTLLGAFNVYNILAATAAAFSQGISLEAIHQGVKSVARIRGRMEPVDMGQAFKVIVDFAHTPNGLEQALTLARQLVPGRVIAVFGAAGLRDRDKRWMMGQIAGRLAHQIVITAEDPRTEDVHDIMAQIARGCVQEGRQEGVDYWLIPDRAEAIHYAIGLARNEDLVITAGKSHEQSMCYGDIEYPWDEFETVRQALTKRLESSRGSP